MLNVVRRLVLEVVMTTTGHVVEVARLLEIVYITSRVRDQVAGDYWMAKLHTDRCDILVPFPWIDIIKLENIPKFSFLLPAAKFWSIVRHNLWEAI